MDFLQAEAEKRAALGDQDGSETLWETIREVEKQQHRDFCRICGKKLRSHNTHDLCAKHGHSGSFDRSTGQCLVCGQEVPAPLRGSHASLHRRKRLSPEEIARRRRIGREDLTETRRSQGMCTQCGAPRSTGQLCANCTKKGRARAAAYRRRLGRKEKTPITITLRGKTQTMAEWSRETGIGFQTIWGRWKKNYPPEKILHVGALLHRKEFCVRGHPRSGDNLWTHKKTGRTHCRACMRERNVQQRARRAEKVASHGPRPALGAPHDSKKPPLKEKRPPPAERQERRTLYNNLHIGEPLRSLLGRPRPSRERLTELWREVRSSDAGVAKKARDELVIANLGLAAKQSLWYRGRGIAVDDLMQAAVLGLHRAIDLFEPERGFMFSTYASNWVKQALQHELKDHGATIRVPVHIQEHWPKLRRIERAFFAREGRTPTPEELSKHSGLPLGKIRRLLGAPGPTLSLDAPFKQGEDSGDLLDTVASSAPPADELMHVKSRHDLARSLLGKLSPREALVMRLRAEDKTLAEIGIEIGVSRERVRQIEGKAMKRLRFFALCVKP